MNQELAGRLLWHVRRAWAGATLCRRRHLELVEGAPLLDVGAFAPIRDLRGTDHHDLDYYAWEAGRIIKLAEKAAAAGLNASKVRTALDRLDENAPALRAYRGSATHPEDNRKNDEVIGGSAAVRILPGGQVEYLLDVRHQTHEALSVLVKATEEAFLRLAAPDRGDVPRFDNSGRRDFPQSR